MDGRRMLIQDSSLGQPPFCLYDRHKLGAAASAALPSAASAASAAPAASARSLSIWPYLNATLLELLCHASEREAEEKDGQESLKMIQVKPQ